MPLLFPSTDRVVPSLLLVQARDQPFQTTPCQCPSQNLIRAGCSVVRVAQDQTQCSERHIWPPHGRKGDFRSGGQPHRAGTPGPQPSDGTDQRALAGARIAHQKHLLASGDDRVRLIDHDPAVVLRPRQTVEMDISVSAFLDGNALAVLNPDRGVQRGES